MILCSNYDYSRYLNDAREYLESIDAEINDESVDRMAYEWAEEDVKFYLDCIDKHIFSHPLLVTGSVGRWDGTYNGGKVIDNTRDFWDLLVDCAYVELASEKNHLYIKCSHHDGTNHYEIRELTNRGYKFWREYAWDMDRRRMCEYLKYNFNSRLPKIEWCL